jgi:predicted metalloendopeptidase
MDIRSTMDTTIDPCVNFYDYACGNFKNRVTLPDDKSAIHRFSQIDDQIKIVLRDLLQEKDHAGDPKSTLFTKQLYRSCLNVDKLEELGLKPLKALAKKYGGWPVVDGKNWKENEYDWIKTNAKKAVAVGGSEFVEFSGSANFKNSTVRTLDIDQASLGLGKREYYLDKDNKKFLDAYYEFMVSSAVQLGATEAAAKEEMKLVLDFETALAEANVRDEDRRDANALYRPMKIKELIEKYPKIDFKKWFNTIAESNWKFDDSIEINLSGAPFLEKLPSLLSNFTSRTFANYQIWGIVSNYVASLAPSLRENLRRFKQALSGTPKFKPRWEECVGVAMVAMELPIGGMYVRKYFSEETKAELDSMVNNIRIAMKNTIDTLDWMDDSTKSSAQKKLDAMVQNIAFPVPDIYNETWLMRDYIKAELTEDNYLDNKLSIIKSASDRYIREFFDPINRTEWSGGITDVNAWYSPEQNKMTFPAAILRYSFYSPSAPDYFNYGHIGAVMGHELTHGFDDQGRQYDGKGNFELWWTNKTLADFVKRAKCMINQYSNVTDSTTGQHLNGENTQGENIADNGGVKLAYEAYRLGRKNASIIADPRNVLLPGFSNFTSDQLYFISYGQTWCTIIREESLKNQIISDEHAPGTYRVNVPLQNNQNFASSFNCPVGSPMNPKEKCHIW